MCGIAGIIDRQGKLASLQKSLELVTHVLEHRGPDGHGTWVDEGVGLGHRRLSIVDLSEAGHQPMMSNSSRYVMSYNGEIYNHDELRKTLVSKGYSFRGHSDTEMILAAVEEWGLDNAVQYFIGMFAIALWDKQLKKLFLVRDRLGIKPLYYGVYDGLFIFASELKSFQICPEFNPPINRHALSQLMRYCFIPAPHSIYEGVYKLEPGKILTIDVNAPSLTDYKISTYWSAKNVAEQGAANIYQGSASQAVNELDELLKNAVGMRMLADVPLGAFLSGGIDSSTVVALMQAQSTDPVKTFSIGFHEGEYNEANQAKAVAEHLGTDHTELYVTPEQAMAVIPELPTLYDEPFADSSQIPTYLVSKLARESVTVSLSGDGGDELFYGYDRYSIAERIWNTAGWMPQLARTSMGRGLAMIPSSIWHGSEKALQTLLPGQSSLGRMSDKAFKLAEFLSQGYLNREEKLYQALLSHWKQPSNLVLVSEEPLTAMTDPMLQADLPEFKQRMMFMDSICYLPDDILVKVDRASMGASLEARVPIIDHRVVEFAASVPLEYKFRDGQTKWILRQVLNKYVPNELFDRPKMGFGVPIDSWLRGPLRDWADDLLNSDRLRNEGYFNVNLVRQRWQEHVENKRDWHYPLWDVLMFQAWHEANH